MSDDQDYIMASSPEISPQTPTITPSPPLRELSMSVSLSRSSSQASQMSLLPPRRDIRSLLSGSPPSNPLADNPTDQNVINQMSHDKAKTIVNSSPVLISRSLPPLQLRPPTLSRLNTCPPTISQNPSNSGTVFGLEAFRLSSPPRHPQPAVHQRSPSQPQPQQGRSFWIPSSTKDTEKPQHQRLASLPSLQTNHRENVYPTPVSITSQRGFPMSTVTPVAHTRRQSEDQHREQMLQQPANHTRHPSVPSAGYPGFMQHPRQQVVHRRHPSSGDANVIRVSQHQHDLHRPMWAAPPPPPPAPAHIPSSQIPGRPQSLGRPRLQIHPYAPPRVDPRYYSAGGIGLHSHTHSNVAYGSAAAMAGYGREGMFVSPSSGLSPGGFKAPRKRADDSQLAILNEIFEKTAYPSTDERDDLAKRLGMTSRSVQIWFQNRRRAVKVDAQSAVQRAEAEAEEQIMIRGPVPIIPKPYPTHVRHVSEGEDDLSLGNGMDLDRRITDVPGEVMVGPSGSRSLVMRDEREDMVLVKEEILSPH